MSSTLEHPRLLRRSDITDGFRSGVEELDEWIRQYAWQNHQSGNAKVYVTVQGGIVLGYYAIAMASYARDQAPDGLNHSSRPKEIPCVLLARLAVDHRAQHRGIGAALLKDAIERSYWLSQEVGTAALLIHCRDQRARDFYLANGEFLPSPAHEMHLLLSMKAIGKKLGPAGSRLTRLGRFRE